MDLKVVRYELGDGVATITLDRPERLNAYGVQMKKDLRAAWEMFLGDADARVCILTGEGRAFCSGRDIKEQDQGLMGNWAEYEKRTEIFHRQHAPISDKPVIAAVNGITAGAGNAMAFAADLRIASEDAVFMWPELDTGVMAAPFYMSLEECIPWAAAAWLFLSGESISGRRADRKSVV